MDKNRDGQFTGGPAFLLMRTGMGHGQCPGAGYSILILFVESTSYGGI